MRIEIIEKQEYLITLDYQLVEKKTNPKRFQMFLRYRYKFAIIESSIKKESKNPSTRKTLIIYDFENKSVINTLFSTHWTYNFVTDEIFTNTRNSAHSLIVHKYYKGKKHSEYICALNPSSVFDLVMDLNNKSDTLSEEDLQDILNHNIDLKSENLRLNQLIKNFQKQISSITRNLKHSV